MRAGIEVALAGSWRGYCFSCKKKYEHERYARRRGGLPVCGAANSVRERMGLPAFRINPTRKGADLRQCSKTRRDSVPAEEKRLRTAMRKYRISRSTYLSLVEGHGGSCGICGQGPVKLHVDHDHKTGAVRGLLCNRCNVGLGWFLDSPAFLLNAINYLRRANPDLAVAA